VSGFISSFERRYSKLERVIKHTGGWHAVADAPFSVELEWLCCGRGDGYFKLEHGIKHMGGC
jgi:hypothetical protein